MDYPAEQIAQQLTLLDFFHYQSITERDMHMHLQHNKSDKVGVAQKYRNTGLRKFVKIVLF